MLLALAQAGGRPVSRDALFERAWPGRAVLDDNLKVQVMALRPLLGHDAVVTVPNQLMDSNNSLDDLERQTFQRSLR